MVLSWSLFWMMVGAGVTALWIVLAIILVVAMLTDEFQTPKSKRETGGLIFAIIVTIIVPPIILGLMIGDNS